MRSPRSCASSEAAECSRLVSCSVCCVSLRDVGAAVVCAACGPVPSLVPHSGNLLLRNPSRRPSLPRARGETGIRSTDNALIIVAPPRAEVGKLIQKLSANPNSQILDFSWRNKIWKTHGMGRCLIASAESAEAIFLPSTDTHTEILLSALVAPPVARACGVWDCVALGALAGISGKQRQGNFN